MKKFLFCLLFLSAIGAKAQQYNNEWIKYANTYYKFKVGQTGLYQIQQSTLAAAGLSNVSAENFQLWRNGVQIPIYTSVATGNFSGSDYIEFWGEMNDGKPDKDLYRNPDFQMSDKWSLESDTALYFLTVNTLTQNLRLATTSNNVATNTLSPEPYFMYTVGKYFRDKMNSGYAVNVGEYLYSASYDRGEGWTSSDIGKGATNSFSFNNLFLHPGGPDAIFSIGVSGNAINPRNFRAQINGTTIVQKAVDYFTSTKSIDTFPSSILSSNVAAVAITNMASANNDRMVIHQYELNYPRQFNFGGATNFEFILPANANGNYLEISGFNYGTTAPVLYDLTNGKRYVVDISSAPLLKIRLEPSAVKRKLLLVSQGTGNFTTVNSLQTQNFINYTATANHGNYLIISHPALFNGPNGTNPVDEYKLYRSSPEGGSYNSKIFLSDELVDQFGFGIKKNPIAIRNFLRYARQHFSVEPKHVFIIGKGVNYVHQRNNESHVDIDKLNLVPTFGWPASDILLSADPGSAIPETPIGRLSAINAQEVAIYLKKVKDFEAAQANMSPSIQDRGWMKNVVHIVGSSEPGLQAILDQYMTNYKSIIEDTLYGAKVSTFTKTTTDNVQQLTSSHLQGLFQEGISLITYFGHSSASTLEFNLDNPENYNNQGKYPLFIGLGCNAGNFFNFGTNRFITKETLSEKWVLAQERGTIGFIASTHFGIVHYLDIWNKRAYQTLAQTDYGKTLGEIMKITLQKVFSFTSMDDFYARSNAEETELHGDPAIRLNTHAKPDYVIEDPMVKINPAFISIAEPSFKIHANIINIGKAISDSISVEITRHYPNQTSGLVYKKKIAGIRYSDSIIVNIPIDPITDKGLNKITITVDAGNETDEFFETNNTVTKEFTIFEDEARPIYPYNFAIVNQQNIKLSASTANPFSAPKSYKMEIDTTEKFNSPLKSTQTLSNISGGVLEFSPGLTFTDSTVYYWRVGVVPATGEPVWNTSSFVYLPNHEVGFNQSHVYQHLKSSPLKLNIDSVSTQWNYGKIYNNLFIRIATFAVSAAQQVDLSVAVNGDAYMRTTCHWSSLVFNVFDPMTFKPWRNQTLQSPGGSYPQGLGLYQSLSNNCYSDQKYNFEFRYTDTSSRRKIMEFMDNVIPAGAYVVIRNFTLPPAYTNYPVAYAADWEADTSYYGSGNSLYHYLKNQGLTTIDSFYRVRPWALVYKKGDPTFNPQSIMAEGMYDKPTMSIDFLTPDTIGYITSPKFGPAKAWKELQWRGEALETAAGDKPTIKIIGIKHNGQVDTLNYNIDITQQNLSISLIDAAEYPYLQLRMRNIDSLHHTPYQLKYWRLTYDPVPEGAVAPGMYFQMKDTLVEVGEPIEFKMAFKNVTNVPFDSVKVKMVLTDRNNVAHVLPVIKHKKLLGNDTLHIKYTIDTRQFVGNNVLYVEVNPDNDQPEQHHFNNFIYKDLFVKGDTLNPLLDVTFDNVHILNHDIVSSKPDILIRLKDEAKWMLLDDTSLVNIQIRYPSGNMRTFNFDNDTLKFTAAQQAPNAENTATINLKPYFEEDGDYELIISGKDKSNNVAGAMQYRVSFQVINKAMISNMLNYPNPFTTSTAFVFTLTGSEVPQNIRIQILTITGKVVKEITKEELGTLRIGRNITEYKWDGTDQYGQKLANGVYLYRVITNLNGQALDKYNATNDKTDKFFNNGYGKMYLMR